MCPGKAIFGGGGGAGGGGQDPSAARAQWPSCFGGSRAERQSGKKKTQRMLLKGKIISTRCLSAEAPLAAANSDRRPRRAAAHHRLLPPPPPGARSHRAGVSHNRPRDGASRRPPRPRPLPRRAPAGPGERGERGGSAAQPLLPWPLPTGPAVGRAVGAGPGRGHRDRARKTIPGSVAMMTRAAQC